MKYVITIIKKIFPKESTKPIGRWRIEQCNKQMISTPFYIQIRRP